MKSPVSMVKHLATHPLIQCVPWGVVLIEIDYHLNVLPKRYRKERMKIRMVEIGQACVSADRQRRDRRRVWEAQHHAIKHRLRRRSMR